MKIHRIFVGALVAASIVVAFVGGWWMVNGGRGLVVRTPSMGTAAPVGTLLWIKPAPFSTLRVGDLVSFHPPGSHSVTFSHRITAVNTDGTLSTKGDINATADPWHLRAIDIIGKVTMRWWGIGWLIRAAPLLIIGGLILIILVRRFTTPRWRVPVANAGIALLISLAVYVLRPLMSASLLSFVQVDGSARATYVSTGLLPIRISATGGNHIHLLTGQVGTVIATHPDRYGHFVTHVILSLNPLWWVLPVAICFLPAVWSTTIGTPSRSGRSSEVDSATTDGIIPDDSSSPYTGGVTVTVLGNTGSLVRTGNTFADWNTAANGSGTSYSANDTFTADADTILYAQWKAVVVYDGNGATGGTVPVDGSSSYLNGATVTVLGNTGSLTKTNHIFTHWNTAANGTGTSYSANDTFTADADTILYAQWKAVVVYDGNGATGGTVPVDGSSSYLNGATVTVLGNTTTANTA